MIRQAQDKDEAAIAGFLAQHIETSMFLLSNLEAHGIGNLEHPHGTHYFLRETGDGITGVFGTTNAGFAMCQLPGLSRDEAQTYAYLLQGYTLHGITGDAAQVGQILDVLPLEAQAWRLNAVEPLYRLDLAGLEAGAEVRGAVPEDVALLAEWYAAYWAETGTAPAGDPMQAALARAEAAIGGPVRLMIEGGQPVAMAALNAQAALAVQVGGVYVPLALRGQGRGGQVVQAMLAEAAREGAMTAILFAASAAAAKAYERIGFQRCGDYLIAILHTPTTLGSRA
jgi:RimJ/RimL family protein N-acetyltransferase